MILDADAVLFDSDGVLVDSHTQVDRAWRSIASAYGLDVEAVIAELAGVRAIDTLRNHLPHAIAEEAAAELEALEIELAGATAPIPGAVALCRDLPDGSWAIATSASRPLALARWAAAGIEPPATVITADDVSDGKPHPAPYLAAAAGLGVDPARCVVVEDSPSGGASGRAAGATTIAVGSVSWAFEPSARVEDLRRVTARPGASMRLALHLG